MAGVTRRVWFSTAAGLGSIGVSGILAGACNGLGAGGEKATRIRSGVTLTFMSTAGGQVAATTAEYAAKFTERHPGLTLQHLPVTGGGNTAFYEKLQASLAAGTPPDICYMHPEFLLSYTSRKLLRSIQPFVRRDHYDVSDFYRPAVEQYRVAGDLYALPRGFAMEVLVYNIDLFERAGEKPPPTNWKDTSWDLNAFLATARRLTAADGSQVGFNAAQLANGGGDVVAFHRAWIFVYATGGAVVDSAGGKLLLADSKSIDGLQYLADLSHKHRVANVPGGTGIALFNQGKAAMAILGAYAFNNVRNVSGLRWGAGVVPRGPGGRFSSGSGVGWATLAAGQNPDETWLALQYICSKEVQELEAAPGNVMPGRKSVAYGPAFSDPSKPPKDVKVFADAGDYTHETPRAVQWPEVADVFAEEFQPLWRGERSARVTVDAIKPKIEHLLDR